jgi:DNA-binding transcriptional regulator YiaG
MTADELKAIREGHRLSRTAFARILGYQPNYLMRVERGEEKCSQRLEKLVLTMFPEKKVRKSSPTP